MTSVELPPPLLDPLPDYDCSRVREPATTPRSFIPALQNVSISDDEFNASNASSTLNVSFRSNASHQSLSPSLGTHRGSKLIHKLSIDNKPSRPASQLTPGSQFPPMRSLPTPLSPPLKAPPNPFDSNAPPLSASSLAVASASTSESPPTSALIQANVTLRRPSSTIGPSSSEVTVVMKSPPAAPGSPVRDSQAINWPRAHATLSVEGTSALTRLSSIDGSRSTASGGLVVDFTARKKERCRAVYVDCMLMCAQIPLREAQARGGT